jgi:hypothetical protein
MTEEETIEFTRMKTARDSLLITNARLRGEIDKLQEVLESTIQLAAAAEGSTGLPQASVSASNVDGNDVTAGETAPTLMQVTPWEFMARVEGREEIVGEPVFWAQWPSKEKK